MYGILEGYLKEHSPTQSHRILHGICADGANVCFQMGRGLYRIVLILNLVVQGQDELVKAQVLGKFTERL